MLKNTSKVTIYIVLALIVAVSMADPASANTIVIKPNVEFSGGTPPVTVSPWLTAIFDDSVGNSNTVRLTMTADNLSGTEFISNWLFNFEGDVNLLQFSYAGGSGPAFDQLELGDNNNNNKADGDGYFDIGFYFPTSSSGSRFGAGDTVVYDITYSSPIIASSFNSFSIGGKKGAYLTAAHVQNTGGGSDSGWIGANSLTVVPEPVSSALFIVGSATLGFISLRKRRRNT